MLSLKKVQNRDRDLLWNINQKYLYEMTNFYDDPMDENGNYHYGYFDEYFSDPKRKAYFICNGGVLVGFAMLCPYSNIEQDSDYTMAEFTIFPSFRRKHLALDAAKMILARHPGKWEIKYNEKNRGAKNLWHTVAGPYEPENWCRYRVVKCCEDRVIKNCGECVEYPCDNMKECFEVTKSFEPMCRKVCTDEEYRQLKRAFFEKGENLKRNCILSNAKLSTT